MKLLYQRAAGITKTCNARCYDAKPGSKCSCICNGELHAIGEKAALEKLREMLKTKFLPGLTRQAERALRREKKEALEAWGDKW